MVRGAAPYKNSTLTVHPWQRGIGTPKGSILAARKIQQWHTDGLALLTVDGKNAFNCVSRLRVWEKLVALDHHDLAKFFRFAYADPSDLVVVAKDGTFSAIQSTEGTKQGDIPAGYFFSLPFGDAVQSTVDSHHIELVQGYMDDLTVAHASPEKLLDFLGSLVPALEDIGLEVNLGKCELVCHPTPAILTRAQTLNLKVVDRATKVIKVLGAPIGDDALRSLWCIDRLDQTAALCDLLCHQELDPQLAYTLLSLVHEPRALYIAQCVEPEVCAEALRRFDDLTLRTFRRIFGEDITPYWAEHPAGAGLYRMERLATTLHQRVTQPPWRQTPGAESLSHVVQRALGPPTTQNELAHALSATGHKAKDWMLYRPGRRMAPHQFQVAMRIRCRAKQTDETTCSCGHRFEDNPNHLLSCQHNREYTATHRHNGVLYEVARVSREYGINVTVEPRCYQTDDQRRPDIIFCLGLRSIATDFTVVDATCVTHAPIAAAKQGGAAAKAGDEKVCKHAANVHAFGHTFYPMAMEAQGHMDADIITCLCKVAREIPAPHLRKAFVQDAVHAIATATQAGNAAMTVTAARRLLGRRSLLQ